MHLITRNVNTLRTAVAVLGFVLLTGCTMPRYMVGLDTVLTEELGTDTPIVPDYPCTIGAHRGDSIAYTENTLEAITSARANTGVAFVEFDVQYSADNKVVVFHDKRLLRVFGRMNAVGANTYDRLRKMSQGEIATYEQIIDVAEGKKVNIEIKSQGDANEDRMLADFIVTDIKTRRIEKDVLISSISKDLVKYIKTTYPELAVGQVFWIKASTYAHFDFLTNGLYREAVDSRADYLMLHVANLRNIENLIRLKPRDKTIVFWNFKDKMYVVHKDMSDRMWGDSFLKTVFNRMRYRP